MELHREEKREEVDRGGQDEKSGVKRGVTNLASNHFPKYSPHPKTHREIHRIK